MPEVMLTEEQILVMYRRQVEHQVICDPEADHYHIGEELLALLAGILEISGDELNQDVEEEKVRITKKAEQENLTGYA